MKTANEIKSIKKAFKMLEENEAVEHEALEIFAEKETHEAMETYESAMCATLDAKDELIAAIVKFTGNAIDELTARHMINGKREQLRTIILAA